jgi:hypothetical protein
MCLEDERHGCIVRCGWWKCNAPFVICEMCEGGETYCSDACRDGARRDQVCRARRKYAKSRRGMRTASWRNTDYRLRRKQQPRAKSLTNKETDHPSTQDPSGTTEISDVTRAAEGSPVRVTEDPCHDDVDSQEYDLVGASRRSEAREVRATLVRQSSSLEVCRFCGARIRLFVHRDALQARITARRVPSTARRRRRPRLPLGPG